MNPLATYVAAARESELARRSIEHAPPVPDRRVKGRHRVLVALLAVAAAAATLTPLAHAGPMPTPVPQRIQVPDGNKPFLVGHAVGVQIYACTPTSGGYAWSLLAPRATLYGDNGRPIATHFAGPTWQATDGSTVVGRRVDGVTVDADAIPWLLLSAASTSAGPDGTRLADTTYVQRIDTVGGMAPPAAGCDAATAGTVTEVPYIADYDFWKATGA